MRRERIIKRKEDMLPIIEKWNQTLFIPKKILVEVGIFGAWIKAQMIDRKFTVVNQGIKGQGKTYQSESVGDNDTAPPNIISHSIQPYKISERKRYATMIINQPLENDTPKSMAEEIVRFSVKKKLEKKQEEFQ